MKYRKLGNTGLIVSEVALGTMQFGGKMNMGNLGQEDTTRMVKLALDRGINFIDTADVYSLGESETLLGNALKGIRQEIVLATKVRLPMGEQLQPQRRDPREHHARGGGQPAAAADRLHRPVPGARMGQQHAAGGDPAHAGRSGAPGEGPLYRALQSHVLAGGDGGDAAGAPGVGEVRDGADVLQPRRPRPRIRIPVVRRVPPPRHPGLEPAGRRVPHGQVQPRQSAPGGTRFARGGRSSCPSTRSWATGSSMR